MTTLEKLATLTAERVWRGKRSEQSATRSAAFVVERLGAGLDVQKLTTARIAKLIAQFQEEGVANATISRRLSALSRMLTFAFEQKLISAVPAFPRVKEDAPRDSRFLTDQEEALLLRTFGALGREDMADLCICMADSGLQVGEALALTWRDVADGALNIRGSAPRTVPLTTRARAAIERRRSSAGGPFASFTHSGVTFAWNQAREKLGLAEDEGFVPRCLRHTFVVRLFEAGADPVTIKELAGHKALTYTLRYAKLLEPRPGRAIQRLERYTAGK